MFKDCFRRKRSKKEQKAPSAVNEGVFPLPNSPPSLPSSAPGSQIPANRGQLSSSPTSQNDALISNKSDDISTHVIEIGANANFTRASAIAIGGHSTAIHKSYHIRLGDQELTESQVEEFMAGLLLLPDQIEKLTSRQSRINLPRITAAHNDYAPEKKRGPCLNGTREMVLKEIGNWLIVGTSRIYVLSGLAGIGKSTIAYTVAQKANSLGLLGASFFFSEKETEQRTAHKFFTTIAFQLSIYDDKFARAIEKVLSTNRGEDAITKSLETQLNVLIIEPLRDLVRSRTQPVVIVIDALDECKNEDAEEILKALEHLVHELPPFKILLTARPRPHLDHLLKPHDVCYLHGIEEKIVNNDIRTYLKFKLSMEEVKSILPMLRTPWNATDEDIDILVQAAGKLFIIASVSVLFILDTIVRNPASQMKRLKTELASNHTRFVALDDFYSIIIRAVVPPGSNGNLIERFQKVVGAILLVRDPLPVDAIADLTGIEELDIYGVLDNMQSVIVLDDSNIPRIYHKSLSEWITDPEHCKDKDHYIDTRNGHTWLTILCLEKLTGLKRNILEIDDVYQFTRSQEALKQERIKKKMLEKISSVVRYACIYWATHLGGANADDANLAMALTDFTNDHMLHWLEGVGWIGAENSFSLELGGVNDFMKKTSLQELRELLSDARRFLFKFSSVINRRALSVYSSALAFTPTESKFYQRYKRELKYNICRVQGGPKRWDAVFASNATGEYVYSIYFGRNGTFASCSVRRIIFWSVNGTCEKVVDGDNIAFSHSFITATIRRDMIYIKSLNKTLTNTIKASSPIISIALSSDGNRLAIAASNGSVTLVVVGTAFKNIALFHDFGFNDRSGLEPCHLAFSPNGDRLGYRLAGGGVALRNAIDGKHIADLKRNPALLYRLVFSPDGSRLASLVGEADDEYTLTLWDCTDGHFLGYSQDVGTELAFSSDGSQIATGGWKNTLKLWNNDDQGLRFIETPHLGSLEKITCLAFSQDGILAIGSTDNGIILYDVKTHSLITTTPFQNPTAVAFSYNCTRLAAGNKDGVVRLLDIPTIKASANAENSQETPVPIYALVFSPDCSRLVSGSVGGIIQVWNTSHASEPIVAWEGHSSKITTLAFTPNGGQFASGDVNGCIKLWCINDCSLINSIQWPICGELTSVAVSNHLLAAATKDSIALWDLHKSDIISRLGECGSMHLSFSNCHDNFLLASFDSDSNDVTVAVWDVGTCAHSATFRVKTTSNVVCGWMKFYPDDSHLFVYYTSGKEGRLRLFSIVEKAWIHPTHFPVSDLVRLAIIPSWKGFPVWLMYSNHKYTVIGLLKQGDTDYIKQNVCEVPEDLGIVKAAYGSIMFALLCKNGSLVLLQSN